MKHSFDAHATNQEIPLKLGEIINLRAGKAKIVSYSFTEFNPNCECSTTIIVATPCKDNIYYGVEVAYLLVFERGTLKHSWLFDKNEAFCIGRGLIKASK